MTPTHIDTPIRRNAVGNTPMNNQFASPVFENDDEAERRASRTAARQSLHDSSIIQHKEGLDNCLKIFNDNKISKDNVWQMALIDHFRALIDKHHKTLSSFQMVGSSLEASSKIYSIRVDSVHADVLRMSSGLIRQKIVENTDESVEQEASQESDQPNPDEEQRPVRKKKRPNRVVSTVTKNKDSINAKLETTAETDAIFAKLNSTVENNNSAKKLLQYVLSSQASELRLRMNYKLWQSNDAPVNDLNDPDTFDEPVVDLPEINWNPTSTDVLRPQLSGYVISNTPAEDDGNEPPEQPDSSFDKGNDQYNDMRFDPDVQVEPIPNEHIIMDLGDMGDMDDMDDFTEDDQHAIRGCRGLRRSTNVITDMMPDDASSNLEYSYRTLTERFTRFWAGPSYWKFKVNRCGGNTVRGATNEKKKKAFKNKIEPVQFDGDANESMFISIDGRPAAKLRKTNIYNRWDGRKTKLPRDFKLDRNRFLRYSFAPGLMFDIPSSSSPQTIESDTIDDNDNDMEMPGFGMTHHDDDDDDNGANLDLIDHMNVTEIGTQFFGAPEQVNQINIKFAKTAKVVDMKQLKTCCLNIIRKDCSLTAGKQDLPSKSNSLNEAYAEGAASFYQLYKELPQKLTKNMKEALSPAVAFYSILHLANDNNFRLIKDEDNGFLIRQIQDTR